MDVEQLLETYRAEIRKLVELNEKGDFSPTGNEEFRRQRNVVWWVKEAVIMAEKKNQGKAS